MKIHYVYKHLNENNEIVYVGHGKAGRAWECGTGKSRNEAHKEWMMEQHPFLRVEIVASKLTKEEACLIETNLIRQLQPEFNSYKGKNSNRLNHKNKALTEDQLQEIYNANIRTKRGPAPKDSNELTLKELADKFDVNRSTIQRALARKAYDEGKPVSDFWKK